MFFILFPVLISLLFAVGLFWYWRGRDELIINKMAIFITSSIFVCYITSGLIYLGATSKANFNEVWNYRITQLQYYEAWNEKVSCSHPIYHTATHIDSKGNITTTTTIVGYQHPYDVDFHPEYWSAIDEYGNGHGSLEETYVNWKVFWKNEHFRDLNRHYHSKNGNMYYTDWPKTFDTIFPYSEIRTYENRVRVSNSVFNYGEPTKEQLVRFPRPADLGNTCPIISYGPKFSEIEEALMRKVNADLGVNKKVHNLILLFDTSADSMSVVSDVLTAWKGTNKNELVIFVGVDVNRNVVWCDVQSWVDNTEIHAIIRDKVITMKTFDFNKMASILLEEVPQYWVKKDFRVFSYISIPISMGWFITASVLFIVECIGVFIFVEKQIQ
jgi:hypothetical protein